MNEKTRKKINFSLYPSPIHCVGHWFAASQKVQSPPSGTYFKTYIYEYIKQNETNNNLHLALNRIEQCHRPTIHYKRDHIDHCQSLTVNNRVHTPCVGRNEWKIDFFVDIRMNTLQSPSSNLHCALLHCESHTPSPNRESEQN